MEPGYPRAGGATPARGLTLTLSATGVGEAQSGLQAVTITVPADLSLKVATMHVQEQLPIAFKTLKEAAPALLRQMGHTK